MLTNCSQIEKFEVKSYVNLVHIRCLFGLRVPASGMLIGDVDSFHRMGGD